MYTVVGQEWIRRTLRWIASIRKLYLDQTLSRCIAVWMLYIREPNVGGVGYRRRRNPYTANHYALPMCQAIPTETEIKICIGTSKDIPSRQYQFCFGIVLSQSQT